MSCIVLLYNTLECKDNLEYSGIKELRKIGIKELREIGEKILTAYRRATPHDALAAAGEFAYLEGVCSLRNILCPRGWEKKSDNNLELTVSPEKEISIVVSSGNKYTGNEKILPSTRNKKGKQTRRIVYSNVEQLHIPGFKKRTKEQTCYSTWIYLYYIDNKNCEMRMELSLPIQFDKNLKITNWQKRIILSPIPFDPTSTPVILSHKSAPEPEIEIRRRANE